MKLLGSLLIVAASASAGFGYSCAVRRQLRQLVALLAALDYMKSEMEYRLTPLAELFTLLGTEGDAAICALFRQTAANMRENCALPPQTALARAVEQTKALTLSARARQTLCTLAFSLGKFDVGGQLRAITLAQAHLRAELDELQSGSRARCRSYETIGVCAGLALAVLLV